LGFAGLDRVPPPPEVLPRLEQNLSEVSNRQTSLDTLIPQQAGDLQTLGIRLSSMESNPHLAKQYAATERKMAALSEQVRSLRREYSENSALLESLTSQLEWRRRGLRDDPGAHIRHLIMPTRTSERRYERVGEAWAAVSLSLLLIGIVGFLLVAPRFLVAGLTVMTLLFVLIESVLRSAFIQTVSEITALLAVVASVILLVHFWHGILVGVLLAVAAFLLFQRLRELSG
jgi:hypothetical protein